MSDLLEHLKAELAELQSSLAATPASRLTNGALSALKARERDLSQHAGQLEQDAAGIPHRRRHCCRFLDQACSPSAPLLEN
jgi:hypothetical protein